MPSLPSWDGVLCTTAGGPCLLGMQQCAHAVQLQHPTSCCTFIATLRRVVCAMAVGPVLSAIWPCLAHKHSHEVSPPHTLPRTW